MVALKQTVFANLFIQIISPIQIFEDLFCHNNMVTFIRNGVSCPAGDVEDEIYGEGDIQNKLMVLTPLLLLY